MNTPANTDNTRWFSLRRRLLLPLLAGMLVLWLITLALSRLDAHEEIDELFDAQLAQAAQTLLATAPAANGNVAALEQVAHKYQQKLMFQIWNHDGRLLIRSPNAPATPMVETDGFSEYSSADRHWRYFSQWDSTRQYRVQVGENHEIRDELIRHILRHMMIPALFGLPLFGLWIWLVTRNALATLDNVAAQIGSREPERLNAIRPASAPNEIRPLLDALNTLFARVEAALDDQRRFTADAAHELRTPLAALAIQAQVALKSDDEATRAHAVARLHEGVSRASHLLNQLLTLARLDPTLESPASVAVALDRLSETACAEHGAAAVAKNIELALDAVPAEVRGNADLLGILLRNLLDNAVRYTPPGGSVHVSIRHDEGKVRLQVSNSGPGIPPDQRASALRRFHRLASQAEQGSGLGLSIVQRIAELHGAELTLSDAPDLATDSAAQPGLCVTVTFKAS